MIYGHFMSQDRWRGQFTRRWPACRRRIMSASKLSQCFAAWYNFNLADFDGLNFVRTSYSLSVPRYPGQRSLRTHPIIPLDFHIEREALLAQMVQRGKRFKELRSQSPGSKSIPAYEGPCFVASGGQEKTNWCSGTKESSSTKSRIFVNTQLRVI